MLTDLIPSPGGRSEQMRKNDHWNVFEVLTGYVFSFTEHSSPVKQSGVSKRPVARFLSDRISCNDFIYFHRLIR